MYAVYVQYRNVTESLTEFYKDHIRAISALNEKIETKNAVVICGDFNLGNRISWVENNIGFDHIPILGESTERKNEIARDFTTTMMNSVVVGNYGCV